MGPGQDVRVTKQVGSLCNTCRVTALSFQSEQVLDGQKAEEEVEDAAFSVGGRLAVEG